MLAHPGHSAGVPEGLHKCDPLCSTALWRGHPGELGSFIATTLTLTRAFTLSLLPLLISSLLPQPQVEHNHVTIGKWIRLTADAKVATLFKVGTTMGSDSVLRSLSYYSRSSSGGAWLCGYVRVSCP